MSFRASRAIVFGLMLVGASCVSSTSNGAQSGTNPDISGTAEPVLLFKSGFEGDVRIDPTVYANNEDYRYIKGTDSESGYSWPINVLGAQGSGLHYIDDDDHRAVRSEIQTVTGRNGETTRALYSVQNYDLGVTQNPYEILNIAKGRKDLYIKYWIKLDAQSLTTPDMWRALFEYKTRGYATGDGFRLIAFVYTDAAGKPFWHWQGDQDPETPLWEIDNHDIPVAKNAWTKMEFYWHFSEGRAGRALWRVNDQVVGDHRGPTTRNSAPIDFIILTQIYGSANPKHQWVDDIEIWSGLPK